VAKSLLLVFILIPLFFFRLVSSYSYDSDFGRDINDIAKIADGDITLLGPKLSFGGIHAGPYYYYLFTPAILLFRNHPESMLYLNAAIFLISFVIIKQIFGLLPSIFLATIPLTIYSARGPGNAFSYISLLILSLLFFPKLLDRNKPILWLLYGFVAGVIINFHLINIIIFGCLFGISLIYFVFKKDFKNIINISLAILGIIISFAPLILFEITHSFVQIRNTFVDQSFKAFTNNTNLSNNPLTTSTNPLVNLWLLQKYFSVWSGMPYLILIITNIILFLTSKKKTLSRTLIFVSSITSFVVMAVISRSQLALHYFFPFIIITVISIIQLISSSHIKNIIYIILIITNLIFLPVRFYTSANRNIFEYQKFTKELTYSELFQKLDKTNFNLYVARETTVAPLGWEYRYFLTTEGYKANIPTEFAQSNSLLIIQENTNHETIDTLRSWEIDEFGPKKLIDKTSLMGRTVYLYANK